MTPLTLLGRPVRTPFDRIRNDIEAMIDEHRVAIEALEHRLAKLEKASDE